MTNNCNVPITTLQGSLIKYDVIWAWPIIFIGCVPSCSPQMQLHYVLQFSKESNVQIRKTPETSRKTGQGKYKKSTPTGQGEYENSTPTGQGTYDKFTNKTWKI